jgi:hypothetical protein
MRQTIVPKFEKIVKFFSRVRASMAVRAQVCIMHQDQGHFQHFYCE